MWSHRPPQPMLRYHPSTSVSWKSPPTTTSSFQFPVPHCPLAASDRLWGAWQRAQLLQRGLIINMAAPAELSDIYSPVSQQLNTDSLIFKRRSWNSLGAAWSQSEAHTHTHTLLQGFHLSSFLPAWRITFYTVVSAKPIKLSWTQLTSRQSENKFRIHKLGLNLGAKATSPPKIV